MQLKITLKRSFIGKSEKLRKILRSLGLRKLNQSVIHHDTPSVRGMIDKVSFMVDVSGSKGRETKKQTPSGE
jgi:large subunit ribosomal protein L30